MSEMKVSLLKRSSGRNALLTIAGILSLSLSLTGCQKKDTETTSINESSHPNPASSAASMTPTAQSVLVEKMKNKEALNANDQMALHMMKPEDRRKLMQELRKTKQ